MAKDPYRYFRIEAQELLEGLGQGLLQLEAGPDPELVRLLLRQAHTFKGASRVVKRPDIGDLAHQIEDLLSPHRGAGGPVAQETVDIALGHLDEIRRLVAALGQNPAEPSQAQVQPLTEASVPSRSEPSDAEEEQTIRVAVRDLDVLLECGLEALVAASAVKYESEHLDQVRTATRELRDYVQVSGGSLSAERLETALDAVVEGLDEAHRKLATCTEQVLTELGELREYASNLRLVPAKILTGDLERVARDAARALHRKVAIQFYGADTHIDAHVLAGLRKALIHVVRNSVAHGIEDPLERSKLGKSSTGRIDISIQRQGHRVSIRCQDDGRGIDVASVRNAAVERGLVSEEAARDMDDNALGRLLLRGGVSTSRTVTGISGRGVGLDAVRHSVDMLKGEVSLRSRAGEGMTVEIVVPLSLSAMPTLAMHIDEEAVLVPLHSVRQALRIARTDVAQSAQGQSLVVGGKVIPFLPLGRSLNRRGSDRLDQQSVVVVEAEGRLAAIGVDRLGAARSVVVRGIPAHAAASPLVAGASFNDAGAVELVLAPSALVRTASEAAPGAEARVAHKSLPILVIDDSLTTRMLEQSILESAGYEVDLAVSGEEGLARARGKQYALFIVDVEMPKMNGFEFIAAVQGDPELRATPSILVTSRGDAADKRRGKEAGARAYIVKSEFDQTELLESIRRLIE